MITVQEKHQGSLERKNQLNLSLKIDTVKDIDPDTFQKRYLRPQVPLLIKGGVYNKTEASKKWDLDFFDSTMGDLTVDIYDNKKVREKTSALTGGDLKMKFSDYIKIIRNNENSDYRMFLFNGFKYRPELRKDFPYPAILKKDIFPSVGFLFFGARSTTVRMHFDIDNSNVLLTQISGRKRVVLIAPEYSELLYRIPYNTFCMVDFDNIDMEKFPALKYVKGYDVMMEPGDSLYMPSGYWHYITYTDGGYALSYRKIAHSMKDKWNGLMHLTVRLAYDKLMNKIAKKWWVEHKYAKARKRAEKAMRKIENQNRTSTENLKPVHV